jgi:hypothetical protein
VEGKSKPRAKADCVGKSKVTGGIFFCVSSDLLLPGVQFDQQMGGTG